jgi:hypothetical protein
LNEERDFVDPNDPNDPAYTVIKNPKNPKSLTTSGTEPESINEFDPEEEETPWDYINRIVSIVEQYDIKDYGVIKELTEALEKMKIENSDLFKGICRELFDEEDETAVKLVNRFSIPIIIQNIYDFTDFEHKDVHYFDLTDAGHDGGKYNQIPRDKKIIWKSKTAIPAWNSFKSKILSLIKKNSLTSISTEKFPEKSFDILINSDFKFEITKEDMDRCIIRNSEACDFRMLEQLLNVDRIVSQFSPEVIEYAKALFSVTMYSKRNFPNIYGPINFDPRRENFSSSIIYHNKAASHNNKKSLAIIFLDNIIKTLYINGAAITDTIDERFVNKKAKLITERILSKFKRL